MLTYNMGFEKTPLRVQHPVTHKWGWAMVPQYTQPQLALLASAVQAALGEHFVAWDVDDQQGQQMTVVTYHGIIIDDVETDRNLLLDTTYQTWYSTQMGA